MRHVGVGTNHAAGPIVRETVDAEGIVLELDTPEDVATRTTLPDILGLARPRGSRAF